MKTNAALFPPPPTEPSASAQSSDAASSAAAGKPSRSKESKDGKDGKDKQDSKDAAAESSVSTAALQAALSSAHQLCSAQMSPVACFASAAHSLCDLLHAVKHSHARIWPSTYDSLPAFQLQQWWLFAETIPFTSPNAQGKTPADLWFFKVPELHMNWVARFIVFAIESLFHVRAWEKVIELSVKFNTLTDRTYGTSPILGIYSGSHFVCALAADYILKFMVYAQQEICAMKMDAMEAKNAELVRLEANMRTEEQAIV